MSVILMPAGLQNPSDEEEDDEIAEAFGLLTTRKESQQRVEKPSARRSNEIIALLHNDDVDMYHGTHKVVIKVTDTKTKKRIAYLFYFHIDTDNIRRYIAADVVLREKRGKREEVAVILHTEPPQTLPAKISEFLTKKSFNVPSYLGMYELALPVRLKKRAPVKIKKIKVSIFQMDDLGYALSITRNGVIHEGFKDNIDHAAAYVKKNWLNLISLTESTAPTFLLDLKVENVVCDGKTLYIIDIDADNVLQYTEVNKILQVKSTYRYEPYRLMKAVGDNPRSQTSVFSDIIGTTYLKNMTGQTLRDMKTKEFESFIFDWCEGEFYNANFLEAQQQMFMEMLCTVIHLQYEDYVAKPQRTETMSTLDGILDLFCNDAGAFYMQYMFEYIFQTAHDGYFNHYAVSIFIYKFATGYPHTLYADNKFFEIADEKFSQECIDDSEKYFGDKNRPRMWWLKNSAINDKNFSFFKFTQDNMREWKATFDERQRSSSTSTVVQTTNSFWNKFNKILKNITLKY